MTETALAIGEDGTRLHVIRRRGDYTQLPFVLVHGLASNARLWDEVGEGLAIAGHGSCAPDLRGHGRSERPDVGYDFGTVASDVAAVVRDVVERRAVLVGQSWGGNVVIETAARFPEVTHAVVCVDGGFLSVRTRYPDWAEAWEQLAPPVFDGMRREDLELRMDVRFAGWPEAAKEAQLANFEDLPDGTVAPRLSRARHQKILRHMWEQDPDTVAASLDVPVWVIAVGDEPEKVERVESFAARLRSGRVIWLDGAHDIHAEQPTAVVDVLMDLVEQELA